MKTIIAVVCAIAMAFSVTAAQATDLPIKIDAIKNQEGYDDAITGSFKIDLLTASSEKISEMISEHTRLKREQTVSELFETVHVIQETDISGQIVVAASETGLFAQPVNYSNLTKAKEASTIPLWQIILLLVVCAAGGFMWSFMSGARKRRRESGVH